jgi:DNA polymerase III subunit epsilon
MGSYEGKKEIMREIVLDTETTGLDPLQGNRIIEIGCVELMNHIPTGAHYQVYLNPERDVPPEGAHVHGLTKEFLADKAVFAQIVDDFLAFIGEAKLVIHNAAFDMGFLNAELARIGFPLLPKTRAVDTLEMARKKFFGAPASLDALCKRFGIDASRRTLHGALLDAELLAEVYLELLGGRQGDLAILGSTVANEAAAPEIGEESRRVFLTPREHKATPEEEALHEDFLNQIKEPLWKSAL